MNNVNGKISVICFYWQGDRWQDNDFKQDAGHVNHLQHHLDRIGRVDLELAARYVNNLYHGVKRFASCPFEFICFTNEELEVDEGIKLRYFPLLTKSGVLPRVYMFSKESGLFGRQVLCLDIDVVITGSLKKLMDYDGLFCTRSKFKPGEQHKLDGDIMSFRAGREIEEMVWDPFVENIDSAEKMTKGRERYWVRAKLGGIADRWDKIDPDLVKSYKRHIRGKGQKPESASIISFHGKPRPHQAKDEWIKEYWK